MFLTEQKPARIQENPEVAMNKKEKEDLMSQYYNEKKKIKKLKWIL